MNYLDQVSGGKVWCYICLARGSAAFVHTDNSHTGETVCVVSLILFVMGVS